MSIGSPERVTIFEHGPHVFDVVDEGPLRGDLVVLLHGFPQNASSWSGVAAYLNAAGLRTVRFDQRGYAPGARPRGRFAYRPSQLVADVAALVRELGSPKVHLVGHDWGAWVAWCAAAERPDLLDSLVTVSVPHPSAFLRSLVSSDQARRSGYMGAFSIPWLPEVSIRRRPERFGALLRATGMPPSEVDRVLAELVPSTGLSGALNYYRAALYVSPRHLRPVTVPTTHVWSTRDEALSRTGAELCERFVKAPYQLEIVDATHWVPDELPGPLAEAIVSRVRGRR
ncbi:alpha/beta hydrolase [Rhodococcus sp. 05-340-1]|uniref:alpha/beta fold hydrolase n=1 Tax=Nocardiaceae TaxID=85025 RepID=UPI000B9C41AA|nr:MULTISPECIES: alpha/beta fold hydrolase [Rhodococcus]OZC87859.1 alpha/beta hydrolase [Rhodococcus sp. 06-412-2C]OZC96508.1 alpha/beta hydrolase [Rhodococcus sp. 06-412-2B]OZD65331.1 alpha/beta hydrolase [Rhodococcus sp. 05-340-2]OZD74681.1 alpha/beta hydrolase [Rhodococcus sp. 05-340-1]OZD86604.1 alpha/beta hydrolase [Rhodococcus sp. 05-339-2]